MRFYAAVLTAAFSLVVEAGKAPPVFSNAVGISGNNPHVRKRGITSTTNLSSLTVRSTSSDGKCTCPDNANITPIGEDTTINATTTQSFNASTEYYFDQLLDHTNPSLGTFKQRYFFSADTWGGPGSPIVLSNPGEQSADGFYADLTGYSMMNALMKELGAAGVVLERELSYISLLHIPHFPRVRSVLGQIFTLSRSHHCKPQVSQHRSSHGGPQVLY
jgi:hypothetical protein